MPEHGPTRPTRYCRKCQYVLDGLPEDRCPECGTPFEPGDPSTYWRAADNARALADRTAAAWRDCLLSACCLAGLALLWLLHGSSQRGPEVSDFLAILLIPFAFGFAISGFRERGNIVSRLACLLIIAGLVFVAMYGMLAS
jgi:hypothetical protein